MLGIGAGDYPEGAQGLGLPFPPLGERGTLPLIARYADGCNLPPSPEIPR